jgi:hypothetical protein
VVWPCRFGVVLILNKLASHICSCVCYCSWIWALRLVYIWLPVQYSLSYMASQTRAWRVVKKWRSMQVRGEMLGRQVLAVALRFRCRQAACMAVFCKTLCALRVRVCSMGLVRCSWVLQVMCQSRIAMHRPAWVSLTVTSDQALEARQVALRVLEPVRGAALIIRVLIWQILVIHAVLSGSAQRRRDETAVQYSY